LTSRNDNSRRRPAGGPRGEAEESGSPGTKVSPKQVKIYPDYSLYDPTILRTVFIQFDSDDWEEEMAALKETDVEMPATVIVDGKTYPLVGLKFRGQSSFGRVPAGSKRSLNLSMDLVDSDQRLYGYKTLNLLNCSGDTSMMSSALYSFVAQDFLPAPKANFVKVVINGESWGIYCNVQQFNKDFVKEHFRSTKGARWKVTGSPNADGGMRYLGEDLEGYKQRFEIKSKDKEQSWRALVNVCKVLNETPSEDLPAAIEPILDVDSLLRFLAIDVAVVNSDGYWTRASDYSLYLDPTGVFHVIPHDMNEAFNTRGGRGGRPGGGRPNGSGPPPDSQRDRPNPRGERPGGFEGRPPEDSRGRRPEGRRGGFGGGRSGRPGGGPGRGDASLDPLVGIDNERMPLRSKILAVPAYRHKYLQYVRTIAEHSLDLKTMGPVIQRYRKLLLNEIKAETRALTSFDAFESMTRRNSDTDAPQQPSLYKFLQDRRNYLLAHEEIKRVESIEIEPGEMAAPVVTTSGP
jgi:spore coat protein CotH